MTIGTLTLKNSLTMWHKPCKLTQIVASNRLHLVKSSWLESTLLGAKDLNEDVNALKVLSLSEEDELSLPELLSVHRGPCETSSHDLGLPLLEGRELLVVLVEELEELLKDLNDSGVHPWSVL